jgi:Concanavalin A-like lectin/glucanases superfamily
VATFDGSNLTYYYDGASLGTQAVSLNTVVNSAGLVLGSSVGGGFTYQGSLDEAAVYTTALAPSHVLTHFNAR